MEAPQDTRRSGRRRVRPVDFWNFEKPEDLSGETVSYNEFELTRNSIFEPLSRKYQRGSATTKVKSKENGTYTLKPGGGKQENGTYTLKPGGGKQENGTYLTKQKQKQGSESQNDPETHTVVGDLPSYLGRGRGKRSADQGHTGTREESGALRVSKKLKLGTKEESGSLRVTKKLKLSECSGGDEGYSTLSEGVVRSPKAGQRRKSKLQRPRENVLGFNSEKSDSLTGIAGEESNVCLSNGLKDVSEMPGKNNTNTSGSLFNLSEQPPNNNKSSYMAMLSLTEKDTTGLEQPSFRNVLSSTVIDAPGNAVFKMPRLPPLRRHLPTISKVSSLSLDPSMTTIPEEREEKEEQQEEEAEKREQIKEREKEKRQQQQEEKEVEREQRQQQQEKQEVRQEQTEEESPQHQECNDAPTTLGQRSQKSPPASVTSEPEGHEQGKDHQEGQEATLTQAVSNQRQSSRVRTKRLEFWNFEKVEVERQDNGEVRVIHKKQDSTLQIQTTVVDCSTFGASGHGFSLREDLLRPAPGTLTLGNKAGESAVTSPGKGKTRKSPKMPLKPKLSKVRSYPALSPCLGGQRGKAKNLLSSWSPNTRMYRSPLKRKLFSPSHNFFNEQAEEEEKIRDTEIRVGDTSGSLFNLSEQPPNNNKSSYMAMLSLTEKDTTGLEQPSFRNVLSSTVIDAPGNAVFKMPRLPPLRRHLPTISKVSSLSLDPSMTTIPEEREEKEEQQEEEPEKREQIKEREKEKRQQQQEEKEVEREQRQQQQEKEEVRQEQTEEESPQNQECNDARTTLGQRSQKSPPASVTSEPEGHEQGKDHQEGREATLTQGKVTALSCFYVVFLFITFSFSSF
ncbi:hypothetical protein GWK47_010989 [Chionoecetes opilio]|uniref:Uncharacterized protein n=1 Tax=Chionoecetes opilio TaxID=41210 RepID=A0A8J4Y416_CHIOP|nr:hypothetical protein GWK47_010989 [Chionoecetes opilio]